MLKLEKYYKSLSLMVLMLPFASIAGQDAEALFQAGEWAKAADAYAIRTAADPQDAAAWFQLAVSARQAERYSVALNALVKAEDLEFAPVRIGFERARLSVLSNDADGAVKELQAIASSGFTGVNFITGDSILSTLEGHAGYDALVAEMSIQAFPCEHDESFAEFDFWVGEWDVHVAGGAFAGSNVIQRAERGCVLLENWTNARGGTGSSINYVDKITGESRPTPVKHGRRLSKAITHQNRPTRRV